jgi:hypothetical protein
MEKIWLSLECCDNDSSEHTNVTLEKSHRFLFLEYHSSYLRKVTKLADAFCTLFWALAPVPPANKEQNVLLSAA